MADASGVNPFIFACEGGLVLDQTPFAQQPGTATELENFEPSITGGYRRISGYLKWNSKTKIAKIKYDSDKTSLDEVQKKIASVGYDTEKYKADDEVYNNLHYCCKYDREN